MTIIGIPGLGGHKNVFKNYVKELAPHDVKFVQLIDWPKTYEEVKTLVEQHDEVVIVCVCYGAQIALRVMYLYPHKVKGIIIIEPFFSEFFWWRYIAEAGNRIILGLIKIKDALGLRRKNLMFVDYAMVEKRPLPLQPFFDMGHQRLSHYFTKIEDILTFNLPPKVDTKTLFIFSPGGFARDPVKREKLKKVFTHADMTELGERTHNIVTLSRAEISAEVKKWIQEKVPAE